MKSLVKDAVGLWMSAWNFLITDDLISFYTFFTVIFAECAFLFANYPLKQAIPLSLILCLHIVNVIICSYKKSYNEGTRLEKTTIVVYGGVYIALLLIGCIFSILLSVVLTIIPVVVTFLWVRIRNCQDTLGLNNIIDKIFGNKIFWCFSQIVVIGLPFAVFVYFVATIKGLPIVFKILIPVIYFILMPFLSFLEDENAYDIFEIAFDVEWSKESKEIEAEYEATYERLKKKSENYVDVEFEEVEDDCDD